MRIIISCTDFDVRNYCRVAVDPVPGEPEVVAEPEQERMRTPPTRGGLVPRFGTSLVLFDLHALPNERRVGPLPEKASTAVEEERPVLLCPADPAGVDEPLASSKEDVIAPPTAGEVRERPDVDRAIRIVRGAEPECPAINAVCEVGRN
jgi:hypothetical protein